MKLPFENPEEKQNLLAKFKALDTLESKLLFWREELKKEYIQFLYFSSLDVTEASPKLVSYWFELTDFQIIPKKEEYQQYNQTIIDDYKLIFNDIAKKRGIYTLSERIAVFEKAKQQISTNQEEFIKSEISKVEKEVEKYCTPDNNHMDVSWKFFKHGFDEYHFKNKEVDFSERFYPDLNNLLGVYQGMVYAQFLAFLEEELIRADKKHKKTHDFTASQQVLILEYWGIFDLIGSLDKVKLAEQLSRLLNKSYQNIRALLVDMRKLKNSNIPIEKVQIRKDLEVVLSFFQTLGLNREAEEVKSDLKKLDQ